MVVDIRNKKKAQSFSADVLIVVVIVLFGALFLVIDRIGDVKQEPSIQEKQEAAKVEAETLVNSFKSEKIIDDQNEVDVQRLVTIDEASLREELGISNKFCVVFEKDGKLVKIDPEGNINGVGSEDILVNGVPCR